MNEDDEDEDVENKKIKDHRFNSSEQDSFEYE